VTNNRILADGGLSLVVAKKAKPMTNGESVGGRNMANLVLAISVTGFAHNSLLLTHTIYTLINPKPSLPLKILQFSAAFVSSLRHAINFHQFYFFKKKEILGI
jgi:hypothetical protein